MTERFTGQARIVFTPEHPKPGERVTLSNADNTGVRMWRWVLCAPVGCELENRPATMSKATFVPSTAGVYEVELFVNEGHDFEGAKQRTRVSIEVGDLTLADRLTITADYMELSLEAHRADEGSVPYRKTEEHIALLREAAAAVRPPVLRDMPLDAARTEALVRLSEISSWLGTLDGNSFKPGHDPADCRDAADRLLRRIKGIDPLQARPVDVEEAE